MSVTSIGEVDFVFLFFLGTALSYFFSVSWSVQGGALGCSGAPVTV